ncbi:hypothetical protein RKE38_13545 [Phycicoccus sp. M110.8]|uniref:hypothetical protein n=1 Tax=Phycicoccus sp. M110.8 TaxID=3075433 RepID=UPI0028FD5F56|nr:hypothetical protein [Phycicoccus sp. M110.8]MDU0314717.1 hypothetical protein [Phycicoccus sp. M110.8]
MARSLFTRAAAVVVLAAALLNPAVAQAAPEPTGYIPLTPARLMDTRPGGTTVDGRYAGTGAITGTAILAVTTRGGVDTFQFNAVALNVTAVAPSRDTYLTVWPASCFSCTPPNASNLNVRKGEVTSNLVVVAQGNAGSVAITVGAGSSHVVVDVVGYFPDPGDPPQASFHSLLPARLMDTRPAGTTVDGQAQAGGALAAGSERTLQVGGRDGIPASGVGAVVLNVTGVAPTAATFLTVWPTGQPRPSASNLNLRTGEVRPNLVIATVGTGGKVSFYNNSGSIHVVADVVGWFAAAGSSYTPMTPGRLLDTRAGGTTVDGQAAGQGPLGPKAVLDLQVTGRDGIPASGVSAVVLNLTGLAATPTYVTAYPTGVARPNASNLNLSAGEVRPILVIVKVGTGGKVRLYNNSGSTNLVADVAGWFGPSS